MILIALTPPPPALTVETQFARALALALLDEPSVRFALDDSCGGWRAYTQEEIAQLKTAPLQPTREVGTSRSRALRWLKKLCFKTPAPLPEADLLLCPSFFSAASIEPVFAACRGPRIAIFHGAHALQNPEAVPVDLQEETVYYLHKLAQFDGVIALSNETQNQLSGFWNWAEIKAQPPITTLRLEAPNALLDRSFSNACLAWARAQQRR